MAGELLDQADGVLGLVDCSVICRVSNPKLQIPSSNALPSPNCQTAGEIRVGVNYVGLLDEVSVFNRALTNGEVQTLYALPKGVSELRP